jgi:MoxR-like ATPase
MDKFEQYKATDGNLLPFVPFQKDDTYLPSEELQAAVNVALALGQPLLITGEPGTGKTQLAFHIAKQFGLGEPLIFHAQTNSIKKNLFYHYDALRHFQYAQTKDASELEAEEMEKREFIRYEALGMAIKIARGEIEGVEARRSVVLIDEIDKAPRDLPNDLLYAIEKLEFSVTETPQKLDLKCPETLPPIIIITSNSEKNLPDAFLRRVVYHHIKFPENKIRLEEILLSKKGGIAAHLNKKALIETFLGIRNLGLNKKPATAELIAWAMLLSKDEFKAVSPKAKANTKIKTQKLLKMTLGILAKSESDLKKIEEYLL